MYKLKLIKIPENGIVAIQFPHIYCGTNIEIETYEPNSPLNILKQLGFECILSNRIDVIDLQTDAKVYEGLVGETLIVLQAITN